jgi:hypothetical protein
VGSNRRQTGPTDPLPAQATAGEALDGRTADFLHGDWNVVRRISDHRTGQAGLFRGQASFRPCAAGSGQEAQLAEGPDAGLAEGPDAGLAERREAGHAEEREAGHAEEPEAGHGEEQGPADGESRVLAYHEHGELRFGGHLGPASRSLFYRELPDGSADVRFADGREFYRLDLRHGTWSAEHPCRADKYLVTVTRLSPDSFTENWRVVGPAKDYELTTTFTRAGHSAGTGGQE